MRKEYDFKRLRKRRGPASVVREAAKTPISIRLDGSVLADLRSEAARLGVPYQTFVQSILHRYTTGDLVDLKSVDLRRIVRKAS